MQLTFPSWRLLYVLIWLSFGGALWAQQTVFNVPSADVLEKGKIYGEVDVTARPSDYSFTFTPRVVSGFGHGIEAGLNFIGMSEPWTGQIVVSPTIKWRFYDGRSNGWSAFAGDNLLLPVRHREYDVGNYAYVELAKTIGSTRIAAGPFLFTPHVVAERKKAGVQASLEQIVTSRLTIAADWYSGNHTNGYFDPGLIFKASKTLSFYATYQIGNYGLSRGNHQLLLEIGYNFN